MRDFPGTPHPLHKRTADRQRKRELCDLSSFFRPPPAQLPLRQNTTPSALCPGLAGPASICIQELQPNVLHEAAFCDDIGIHVASEDAGHRAEAHLAKLALFMLEDSLLTARTGCISRTGTRQRATAKAQRHVKRASGPHRPCLAPNATTCLQRDAL